MAVGRTPLSSLPRRARIVQRWWIVDQHNRVSGVDDHDAARGERCRWSTRSTTPSRRSRPSSVHRSSSSRSMPHSKLVNLIVALERWQGRPAVGVPRR